MHGIRNIVNGYVFALYGAVHPADYCVYQARAAAVRLAARRVCGLPVSANGHVHIVEKLQCAERECMWPHGLARAARLQFVN